MSELETLQNWLAEKIFGQPDCRNQQIETGVPGFSYRLRQDAAGRADPLQIAWPSVSQREQQATFRITAGKKQVTPAGVIKRIAGTPFYHSYLVAPTYIADIIDFYEWGDHPKLYRLFILRSQSSAAVNLQVSFAGSGVPRKLKGNLFQVGKRFWSAQPEFRSAGAGKELSSKLHYNGRHTAVVLVGISADLETAAGTGRIKIYKLLKSLTDRCAGQNIRNYFCTNNQQEQAVIDEQWARQKTITPEWNIAASVLADPVRYQRELTWAAEIADYFNNQSLLQEINRALRERFNVIKAHPRLLFLQRRILHLLVSDNVVVQSPPGKFAADDSFLGCWNNDTNGGRELSEEQILYRAYFCGSSDEESNITFAQQYWNRLSLPLFECKLERELKTNPEKIVLLLLLGSYYNLPWTGILYSRIKDTQVDPLLYLYVLLQRQIQKRDEGAAVFIFKDGPERNYTGKSLFLFDKSTLHLSRFGKRYYVQYLSSDRFRFRIDKRIRCQIDSGRRRITVYPDVPFYNHAATDDRRIEVQSGTYTISWPWLWPQAEMFCGAARFRWIFKKRRYQITIQRKNDGADLLLDGQVLAGPPGKKLVRYYEIKNTFPAMLIHISDEQGRDLYLRPRFGGSRQIHLSGWMKNRHNQFVDNLSYSYGPRQHSLSGTALNGVQSSLHIPAATRLLTFAVKGLSQTVELSGCPDLFWEKLCNYPVKTDPGCLGVLIDNALKEQAGLVQNLFDELFAFQPRYFFSGQKPACAILLYLSTAFEGIELRQDKKISQNPYLIFGVKQGIEHLKRFSNHIKFNTIKVYSAGMKRSGKA